MKDYELSFPFLPELQDRAKLTQVSLELPEKLTIKEWEQIGRGFGKIEQATQWWVGDWWAFGEHKWGDRKALVESDDWNGAAYQTCKDGAWVCRAFERSLRRDLLSFNHHKEVAAIKDQALRESLLDWCETPLKNGGKKPRSIRELQGEIVVRHNNSFFDSAVKEIDEILRAYPDVETKLLKATKGAIIKALMNLVKQRNREKISVTEIELRNVMTEVAEKELGSVRGNVKMLVEFIGPIRRLAARTDFDFDQMIKAVPDALAKDDLLCCETVSGMLEVFIDKLEQKITK